MNQGIIPRCHIAEVQNVNKNKSGTITIFDPAPYVGGGQTVLLALTEAARRVANNLCLAIPVGGPLEKAVRARFSNYVRIVPVPEPKLTYGRKKWHDVLRMAAYTLMLSLRHIRLASHNDLLYANGARHFPVVLVLSLLTRKRACYHIHIDHTGLEKRFIALLLRRSMTVHVIVNSRFIYTQLVAARPELLGNSKLIVIENGLAPHFAGLSFVDRFTTPPEPLHIAMLGVIRPEKGQDIGVELARRDPSVHVHLIGRAGEGAEAWVARLRAEAPSNVTFQGIADDVPRKLNEIGAHINLVASRWEEPFGIVAIEGMACSCITLVRSCGALTDIAAKTEALVYGDDINDLLYAVRWLRERPAAELSVLARRQHDATMAEYNPERFIGEITRLLSEAVAPKQRAACQAT